MIERVALVKLLPELATDAVRRALAEEALETLRGLPGVLAITVGVPADEDSGKAWDLCVTVRFATRDAAAAYRAHPVHRHFVDDVVAPKSAARKGWTFEVATG